MNKNSTPKVRCQVFIPILAAIKLLISCVPATMAATNDTPKDAYWVFFTEKSNSLTGNISEKAAARRLSRAGLDNQDWVDSPVNAGFVADIVETGAEIRVVSRWLNGVSVMADSVTLSRIGALSFVTEIRPVASYSRPIPEDRMEAPGWRPGKISAFDYGPSALQVTMLAIDSLHNMGLSGRDILIGVMDTGFDTSHVSLDRLTSENRVLATYDFINGDSNVVDLPNAERFHGTAVLSIMAGFEEGRLIGTAYGAQYILAKTEILVDEIRAEEDYWVAGAEWMESLGVDIINSSVGYIDWYDTTQLDGNTAVVTRAADIAAGLGVVVVNSAGNEGNALWRKVTPPADGDSVIAAGAVDSNGELASFSSRGPTADGRIKPDFCALGVGVYLADYVFGYSFSSGTSYSSPLLAGGIALLLEGHPDWNLSRILSFMKRGSSRAFQPDNAYGWGIPNFVNAFYAQPFTPSGGQSISVLPHPAVDSAVIYLEIAGLGTAVLSVHDISGAEVEEWSFDIGRPETIIQVWNGRNRSGQRVASGIYILNLETSNGSVRHKLAFIAN